MTLHIHHPLLSARPTALATAVAFAMLGAGSGASAENTGTSPINLEPVVVEGTSGVITEGTGSYDTGRATVGYKQPVDIREVPQTVNVLTCQRLEDGAATSIEEAAYLLPNLTTATGNGFVGSLYSRGHEVFTYNVDGAPRPFLSLYGSAPDLVFFDRVEVLSGPSGIFQGSGEPVGTMNLVRKRAPYAFAGNAAASVGRWDFRRAEADVGGPLAADGAVRGRLVAFDMAEESFIDFAERDRSGAYGTLEADVGEATSLAVGGIHEHQDVTAHSGLPTFTDGRLLGVSPETYIGAPWNRNDYDTKEYFAEVEHEFSGGAVLKIGGRIYDRDTDIKSALATTGVDPATGDFNMMVFARDWVEDVRYLDANLTTPFAFRGRRSEFTVGADRRDVEQKMRQNFDFSPGVQNIATFDPTTLAEPAITFPGVGPGFRLNTVTESDETGIYGYARLALSDTLTGTFGARYANYDSEVTDTGRNRVTEISEDRVVPFAGLAMDVSREFTLYASYSEIFQPQSEQRVDGSQLDPLVGRQVELGIKAALFDGRASAQAAVFHLEDEDRAIDDPDNVGFFVAAGDDTTRGFEASMTGRPLPGLDIAVGYAYVDTDLDSDPTSPHSASAQIKYTFREGPWRGLYAGLSARAASSFEARSGTVTIDAPGYGVAGLLAGYSFGEHLEARLVVNNIFDKEYVERINDVTRGVFYGEPRNAMLTLKATF